LLFDVLECAIRYRH